MRQSVRHFSVASCAALMAFFSVAAHADTFSIQYFEAPAGSADFFTNGAGTPYGTSLNYVTNTLGPDGLPVFNMGFTGAGVAAPTSGYLNHGEITYWTPGVSAGHNITADGTGTISLSSTPVNMFAPGTGGKDTTYEETAILTGQFTVPNGQSDKVTFSIGADDAAFAYVFPTGDPGYSDSLVESLGGIHSDTSADSSQFTYGPGTYTIEIFYADLNTTDAALSFTDNGSFTITPSATPEPSGLALLGSGMLGLVGLARRRFAV